MDFSAWFNAYKPAAMARSHAFLAASMWTVVGTVLTLVGVRWVISSSLPHAWLFVLVAVVAGVLKSRFVLERSAGRAMERIRGRGDGRCVGGFFSFRTWLFVVAMACLGRILRGGLLPPYLVGLLYIAVGIALVLACRKLWAGWYRLGAEALS